MAKKSNGKMVVSPRVDRLVAYYIQLRNEMKAEEKAHQQKMRPFEEARQRLTAELLAFLDISGQEMARTNEGTVSARVKDTASLEDPTSFIQYVRKNDAYELMDRRANGTACKEFAKEHGQLPPGVKISSMRFVSVRSPAEKEDL